MRVALFWGLFALHFVHIASTPCTAVFNKVLLIKKKNP
jgi:hypothetical protein